MPFQPQINQIGPMLIERGYSNAANFRLQGAQAMAAGISQAGSSIGNAVAGAAAKWQQEAKQADTNAGMLSTYHAMNEQAKEQTGQGIMPDSFFEAVTAAKNKDQQSGMLVAAAPNFDSFISQQRQIAVANAAQKAGYAPSIVDLGNGRQAFMQSKNSAQFIPDPKASNGKPVIGADGYYHLLNVQDGTDVNTGIPAPQKVNPDPVHAAQLAQAEGKVAELAGKVAGKQTSGFFGWGTPYADQLREAQAERDSLKRQPTQEGTRASGSSGPTVDRASAIQQADAAIKNGADPAAVKTRLKTLGIDY